MTDVIVRDGKFDGNLHYGINGTVGSIPINETVDLDAGVIAALADADVTAEPVYLLGEANGDITIIGAGNRAKVGSIPLALNGVIEYLATNTPITPTADQLAALDAAGIAYELEYDYAALAALTLDNATVTDAAIAEDPVGNVEGETAGSTLELTDDAGGLFALVGGVIEVADTLVADTYDITITETLEGYENSPRATVLQITVTAA